MSAAGLVGPDDALREERKHGYEGAREDVLAVVPRSASRVLDLGCSVGALGAAIKDRQEARVVGVELVPDYAREAEGRLDRTITGDLSEVLADPEPLGSFDCIIAADVLEHLVDPWEALSNAVRMLEPGGTAIVSLPNVRYYQTFFALFRGTWPREPSGIFDATHLRWFTRADAVELLEGAGVRVEAVHPQCWGLPGWRNRLVPILSRTRLAPLVQAQYVLVGRKPAADVSGAPGAETRA